MPVIVVHGGAGFYLQEAADEAAKAERERAIQTAARAGWAVLRAGGSALDAAQAAVQYMEDDPLFNAGRGSYYTAEGTVEMDASIMDGATLRGGGVAGLTNVRSAVGVARLVMDRTEHVLLAGPATLAFALQHGVPRVEDGELLTDKATAKYNSIKGQKVKQAEVMEGHDTVGAVAMDAAGNLAYAGSTGGTSGKLPGRVGDTPIIGAGGYAENGVGAVAATGMGEAFVKMSFCRQVALALREGHAVQGALQAALQEMKDRKLGTGGAIAIDGQGHVGVDMNTHGMAWASTAGEELLYGAFSGERHAVKL